MKPKFIRDASMLFVAAHHEHPNVERAIQLAEALWDRLCAQGYGTGGKAKTPSDPSPRATVDYYAKLSKEQKPVFDEFWVVWRKHGTMQRAVMRFIQLWDVIQAEKEQLFSGARKEAELRQTRTTTSPYPELWLKEFRWRDYAQTQQTESDKLQSKKEQELHDLKADLRHFKDKLKHDQNDFIKDEIKRLEGLIKEQS